MQHISTYLTDLVKGLVGSAAAQRFRLPPGLRVGLFFYDHNGVPEDLVSESLALCLEGEGLSTPPRPLGPGGVSRFMLHSICRNTGTTGEHPLAIPISETWKYVFTGTEPPYEQLQLPAEIRTVGLAITSADTSAPHYMLGIELARMLRKVGREVVTFPKERGKPTNKANIVISAAVRREYGESKSIRAEVSFKTGPRIIIHQRSFVVLDLPELQMFPVLAWAILMELMFELAEWAAHPEPSIILS